MKMFANQMYNNLSYGNFFTQQVVYQRLASQYVAYHGFRLNKLGKKCKNDYLNIRILSRNINIILNLKRKNY